MHPRSQIFAFVGVLFLGGVLRCRAPWLRKDGTRGPQLSEFTESQQQCSPRGHCSDEAPESGIDESAGNTLLMNAEKCSFHGCLLEQMKNYQGGENFMPTRSPGHTIWKDMRKKCVERDCELANKKTKQFYNLKSLLGYSSFQERRTGTSWKIAKSMLTNCLEMLVLGTNW